MMKQKERKKYDGSTDIDGPTDDLLPDPFDYIPDPSDYIPDPSDFFFDPSDLIPDVFDYKFDTNFARNVITGPSDGEQSTDLHDNLFSGHSNGGRSTGEPGK